MVMFLLILIILGSVFTYYDVNIDKLKDGWGFWYNNDNGERKWKFFKELFK